MTTSKIQWIEIRLKEGEKLSDQTVKINTFFAMHSHLPEQGYTLDLYLPEPSKRDEIKVAYLKSDNSEFIENCCGLLETAFHIKEMPQGFVPPKSHTKSKWVNEPALVKAG